MKAKDYVLLRAINSPEYCYLSEALLWRAFGRFPEAQRDNSGGEWRFSSNARDSYDAPIPDGFELTEAESHFAGLPNDPAMVAILSDGVLMDADVYDNLIATLESYDQPDRMEIEKLKEDKKSSEKYEIELEKWTSLYDEYVDQFHAEICLKLRRGELVASGSILPDPDRDRADAIMSETERWLDDLAVVKIEKVHWISQNIDWQSSAIFGREQSFVWVHIRTDNLLQIFPPIEILGNNELTPIAGNFILSSSTERKVQLAQSRRGRPSLPWIDFHVETARMFRDGQMPAKKEAAIAEMQDWFQRKHETTVSRAAIGEKLKPYFDELVRK